LAARQDHPGKTEGLALLLSQEACEIVVFPSLCALEPVEAALAGEKLVVVDDPAAEAS